jgi:hypothetical protein
MSRVRFLMDFKLARAEREGREKNEPATKPDPGTNSEPSPEE